MCVAECAGYLHRTDKSFFILIFFDMNRQSNLYTILYASLLVLAVGILLSVVYQALRPMQKENIDNDTKRQILAAALISPRQGEEISQLYSTHILKSYIVNCKGEITDPSADAFSVDVAAQTKLPPDERLLPVFECSTANGIKYIIPVYGAGLWGPIWGYVAFNQDGNTIYGAYFAHQGETPGLGAEIEKPSFTSRFEGKKIFSPGGDFTSVAVAKPGHEPEDGDCVNSISGATITSQGVGKMLRNSLEPYSEFLLSLSKHN